MVLRPQRGSERGQGRTRAANGIPPGSVSLVVLGVVVVGAGRARRPLDVVALGTRHGDGALAPRLVELDLVLDLFALGERAEPTRVDLSLVDKDVAAAAGLVPFYCLRSNSCE